MTDKKYDTGKPMVGLMKKDFHLALIAVAEVTSYGVKKYNQPGSWRTVENALDRYEDALGRHDLQGTHELCCPESGLTHLAHRAWNALATLQLMLEEREEGRKDKEVSAIDILSKNIPDRYAGLQGRFPDEDGALIVDPVANAIMADVRFMETKEGTYRSCVTSIDELYKKQVTVSDDDAANDPMQNVYTWVCSNCGVRNDNSNIYTCQRCGHRRC